MSDKAVYIKDNDEPCQLCQEQSGFCHIHADAAETSADGFSGEDAPNYCPECENPIRVHSAGLQQQRHNPNRVNMTLHLRCDCAEAEVINAPIVEAAELPDKWL